MDILTCLASTLVLGLGDDPAVAVHDWLVMAPGGRRERSRRPQPYVTGGERLEHGECESLSAYWTRPAVVGLRFFVWSVRPRIPNMCGRENNGARIDLLIRHHRALLLIAPPGAKQTFDGL